MKAHIDDIQQYPEGLRLRTVTRTISSAESVCEVATLPGVLSEVTKTGEFRLGRRGVARQDSDYVSLLLSTHGEPSQDSSSSFFPVLSGQLAENPAWNQRPELREHSLP